ncbi:MAG: hypothetical protein ACK43K_07610 [Chitinophagales bacterium]|jgi:hypothetical protein|nr:hypothetical protein [Sphingobacteriales bacterium]
MQDYNYNSFEKIPEFRFAPSGMTLAGEPVIPANAGIYLLIHTIRL